MTGISQCLNYLRALRGELVSKFTAPRMKLSWLNQKAG
jgi:hypothetical protein